MSSKQEISQKYANQGSLRIHSPHYNPEHVLIAVIRQSFGTYLLHAQADYAMAETLGTCGEFRKQLIDNQSAMHRVLNNDVSAQELLNAWLAMPELPSEDEIYQAVDNA